MTSLFRPKAVQLTLGVAVSLAVLFAFASGEAPEKTEAPEPEQPVVEADAQGIEAFLEEDARPFFVELSRTNLFGFEAFTSIRFVAWRQIYPDRREGKIRMALGYGAGLGRELAADDESAAILGAFMGLGMDQFNERLYFQISADEARDLANFVAKMEKIELARPDPHVETRYINASWGDFQVQRNDNGLFVFVPGDPGGWEPLPARKFKAALMQAGADLERLEALPPSAELP